MQYSALQSSKSASGRRKIASGDSTKLGAVSASAAMRLVKKSRWLAISASTERRASALRSLAPQKARHPGSTSGATSTGFAAVALHPDSKAPKDAKVLLAKEITARFHNAAAAEAAHEDFQRRAAGGVPDQIPELTLSGAPLAIGNVLKQAGLVPSTSEALRMVEQGGVRVEGSVVSDKGLKLAAGTYVVQVGKRKFARVTLGA